LSSLAIAGSPDGLQLVLVGTAKAAAQKPALDAFFKRYNPGSTDADCEDTQLNINSVYADPGKAGITPELAIAATTSKQQRAALGKLMSRFRDKSHDRGFDGALVYDVQNDKILLYGISAMSSIKQYVSVLPLSDLQNPKKANLAVCHALVQLPVLAEP
jgi:hypothetical protein